jgi:hypothetical protein
MERLGTPPTQTHSLLAGPSVFGVQMPGHGAAVSITQVTTCLLLQKSDYDRWCMAKAIHKMRLRTIEVFARAASRV